MNEFLEIGEIVEAVSKPVKVGVPTPPVPPITGTPSPAPKGPNSETTKQLLYIAGGVAVGLLIYYLYKKYQDENSTTRNKP